MEKDSAISTLENGDGFFVIMNVVKETKCTKMA